MNKIISFEGGSGFGKSTIANEFKKDADFLVYSSISQEVNERIHGDWIKPAEQFSDVYYDIRLKQHQESLANTSTKYTLYDRFLFFPIAIRIVSNIKVPNNYYTILENICKVDKVFIFEPIPLSVYEDGWPRDSLSYDESMYLNETTLKIVENMGYKPIVVSFDTVENRCDFIRKSL